MEGSSVLKKYYLLIVFFFNGKSMFQEVNLKINVKWVQRVEIRLISTFDQKIIVFEELKENFIK